MPRTKRPTAKVKKSVECEERNEALKKVDKIVEEHKRNIDAISKREVKNIDLAFKILIESIPKKYLEMTVGQLKQELYIKEGTSSTGHSSHLSHDDGYNTENSSHGSGERGNSKLMAPPSSTRSTRRSRSADASATCRKPAPAPRPAAGSARRRSRSVYRTPAYSKNAQVTYPAITPKVAPHTPLTVLRQPRQGEMVVSMTGSPVMVPSYSSMQANCNIPLQDGTMLSLQPQHLRQSQAYIPYSLMDSNVLAQLKTLKDNIDKVVKMGEMNRK